LRFFLALVPGSPNTPGSASSSTSMSSFFALRLLFARVFRRDPPKLSNATGSREASSRPGREPRYR
jgi:hypothetical protein